MVYLSLRQFVEKLEATGRLWRVAAVVDRDFEIACIARWLSECVRPEAFRPLYFARVKGQRQPVLVGLFGSRQLYAEALGVEPGQLLDVWGKAMAAPVPPVHVQGAPVHDHILESERLDLGQIPVPVWTPGRDAGPYIASASVITKDPETGIQNVGVYRVQVHNATQVGLFFGSDRQHGCVHLNKYRRLGQAMPVALVVGAAPVVQFAAAAKTAYGVDELTVAGGLAGAPVEVVRGRTVDLLVPADAEYVIEGYVEPDRLVTEGPFGEALGFMNLPAPAPVVDVSAVCHRTDPFFQGYVQQLPPSEGHLIWEQGILGPLWYYLRERLALRALADLAIVPGAAGLSMLAVQVAGTPSEVREVLETLASFHFGQKVVIVVDDDIDIRDLETLQWALSSRADPQRDVRIVPDVPTYLQDPSTLSRATTGGRAAPFASSLMIIDATLKCSTPEVSLPTRAHMHQVLQRWGEYGLPDLVMRGRLNRLLDRHPDGLLFQEGAARPPAPS